MNNVRPTEKDKILDLGSEDGKYIASIVPFRENVYIADISKDFLDKGKRKYGFKTILLNEDGSIPVPDKYFDIVHCSSVIEHVTIDKNDLYKYRNDYEFRKAALLRQRKFAQEIKRVGKRYFVQTPNRYFFIESHTWLPFIGFLNRPVLLKLLEFTNKFWVKKTSPDWNLLSRKEMSSLFEDARLIEEKFLGMTKSIVALKSNINA